MAECRKAETGVGAAIAPGSHEWNGTCADFVNAPSRISTIATLTAVAGWRISGRRYAGVVAAALFLSPKTVEYHLRHVYIKLAISSRRELAERVAADPELRAWIVDGFVHGALPWFTKFNAQVPDPRWIEPVVSAFTLHEQAVESEQVADPLEPGYTFVKKHHRG